MCDHNTPAAALLRQLDLDLSELWCIVFQCGAVADAIAATADGLGFSPVTPQEVGAVQGLAGAAGTLARQAGERVGKLQEQVWRQVHAQNLQAQPL